MVLKTKKGQATTSLRIELSAAAVAYPLVYEETLHIQHRLDFEPKDRIDNFGERKCAALCSRRPQH